MHENIHAAAGRLKGRQRHGQLRIHDGKGRTGHIRLEAALEAVFLVGHNGRTAHLAARGGDGHNAANGQACVRLAFAHVIIPHVPLVGCAVSNRLGRVDNAAAAHCQHKIHLFSARQFNALADQRKPGVGHYTAKGDKGQTFSLKRGLDPVHKARAQGALPAKVYKHLAAFAGFGECTGLLLCIFAENNPGGRVVRKIVHGNPPDCKKRAGGQSAGPERKHQIFSASAASESVRKSLPV